MRTGWQTNLYAYVRNYPDQASMGMLSFEDLHVQVLSPDAALVFGRFRLVREEDEPLGLFSLIFVKEADGWRIIHDHTSSSP
jgi:ketosteroid isomerase-like protein